MDLTYLGAAGQVTGSMTLVTNERNIFSVDCGMFQGGEDAESMNWNEFPFSPYNIDFVLLTHAHLDHCGRLPLLVKHGFSGKIYCTDATADIASIIMKDAAHIMEEDAKYEARKLEKRKQTGNKFNRSSKRPHTYGDWTVQPLYTTADAEAAIEQFHIVPYNESFEVGHDLEVVYRDAGHILGSSTIQVTDLSAEPHRSIVFSGDLGKRDQPIIRDPQPIEYTDTLQIESTYGNRIHKDLQEYRLRLASLINRSYKKGGRVLIPAFAIGRTQTILYELRALMKDKLIPNMTVFLDSPMAIEATRVYKQHLEMYDKESLSILAHGDDPLDLPDLRFTQTTMESKKINSFSGPCIIISASGMMTGGRVRHHLKRLIEDKRSTVIFVGYQAYGTLGRLVVERTPIVRIFDKTYKLKAHVGSIHAFSAHADQYEILKWIKAMKEPPRRIMLNHGEPEASRALKEWLETEFPDGTEVTIAQMGQTYTV